MEMGDSAVDRMVRVAINPQGERQSNESLKSNSSLPSWLN